MASGVSTRGGRSSIAFRIILAFGAFLVALELASYLSGRYFSYSLGAGAQNAQKAAQQLNVIPAPKKAVAKK